MASDPSITYRFGDFELDSGRFELRRSGQPVHLEPQVLSLLMLLAGNADRMVSKDEVIERIWGGRIVSEAAVASRVKAARQALGDDGKVQRFIRTVHGKGLRFAAEVSFVYGTHSVAGQCAAPVAVPAVEERPSIAVLPLRAQGLTGALAFLGDGLADELIADLSRLRWLMVIARASTFRFRNRVAACEEIGAALNVRYCLTGSIEQAGSQIVISVELARTVDSAVIWAERYSAARDELPDVRRELLSSIIANLESRILHNEMEIARRTPAATLDAWSSYHLGLDHMFRFNRADNGKAAALFERALTCDPQFSRALSGLSFTRFQDCFLQYSDDGEEKARQARALAEEALCCDPFDPFAHLNLGRSLWLENALPESIERLVDCVALSPSYAHAIYSKAWAEMTQCDVAGSETNAAMALRLSPLDPMRYAMLAVRAMSAFLAGDGEGSADLGEKAARSPGAHKHIALIAALTASEAGRADRAAQWVERARQLDPHVNCASFLRSFPFAESTGRERIERILLNLRLWTPLKKQAVNEVWHVVRCTRLSGL